MARFETFDRDIKIATVGLSQEEISKQLAAFAKSELADQIAQGNASPRFTRYVNGREGLPEEAVNAPGPILYVFSFWQEIVADAISYLRDRGPRKSGRYSDSHILIVAGRRVPLDYVVPINSEVIITNIQPYTRKIEVGAMKMTVAPRVYEAARQYIRRTYGDIVNVQLKFLNLPAGIDPLAPYILKGDGRVRLAKQTQRSSAFRAGRSTLARNRDRKAGQPISYPSLVMNARD